MGVMRKKVYAMQYILALGVLIVFIITFVGLMKHPDPESRIGLKRENTRLKAELAACQKNQEPK